jgi:hypothetical protein
VTLPVAIAAVLFPGQGAFPYPGTDFALELAVSIGIWLIIPRRERALRTAGRLYVVAMAASFVLPTPMGGNIGRLGECFAIPLVACLLWPLRRWLLVAVAVPLALWQWTPAWGAITHNPKDPSAHLPYYQPLVAFLDQHRDPPLRVEVVPTKLHWEVAYVAPTVELARGWERQLDTARNSLFYTEGGLNATTYRAWLADNGVRYVALSDATPDYAAIAEARVVDAGVPGLRLVWRDVHWRVFEVVGAPGIVEGPAHLVSYDGDKAVLDVTAPGAILIRIRYTSYWTIVVGSGCLERSTGGWTTVTRAVPGQLELQLKLVAGTERSC